MRLILFTLALVPLTLGCLGSDDAPADGNSNMTATPTPTMGLAPVDKAVSVGEVAVPPGYSINPARLELTVGVPVNLTFTNGGEQQHDLVIEGLDVAFDAIGGGESATMMFTPTEAGEYPMYCTIGVSPLSHRERGMAGTVVVAAA